MCFNLGARWDDALCRLISDDSRIFHSSFFQRVQNGSAGDVSCRPHRTLTFTNWNHVVKADVDVTRVLLGVERDDLSSHRRILASL